MYAEKQNNLRHLKLGTPKIKHYMLPKKYIRVIQSRLASNKCLVPYTLATQVLATTRAFPQSGRDYVTLNSVSLKLVQPKPRLRTKSTCPKNRKRESIEPNALVLSVSLNLIRISIILLTHDRQDNGPPKISRSKSLDLWICCHTW